MSGLTGMTARRAREILAAHGWLLHGTRAEGYVVVSMPEEGDFATGPYETPAEAVAGAREIDDSISGRHWREA